MSKRNIICSIIFTITLIFLFTFSVNTFESISTTTNLYITKVFPSLFLFILFTDILLSSNMIYYISSTFGFISKILHLTNNASIPIIIGFLCGFPSASSSINKLYKENKISINEAHHLMSFCNNASPIFIISTVGFTMLGSKKIGIYLFIIHIVSSIIIAIIYPLIHNNKYIIQKNNINLKSNITNVQNYTYNLKLNNILSTSLINAFKSMLYIFGYMVIFNIFADILASLNIPNIHFITSCFELTKGISNFTKSMNIPYIAFLLGFSSFSIIFQIKNTLKDLDYSIFKLIFFKLLHGLISFILAYFIIR